MIPDTMPTLNDADIGQSRLDSRDVDEAITQLTELVEAGDADLSEVERLARLTLLRDEAKGYTADWDYGEQLILDSDFRDYAEELAEDLVADVDSMQWPWRHVDWDKAAEELKQDYTAVDIPDDPADPTGPYTRYWTR